MGLGWKFSFALSARAVLETISMSSFGGCRTAAVRMTKIFEVVKSGVYPNCSSLAKMMEVRPKTIQRDITYMRDQMGVDLVYNKKLFGYELDADVEFPLLDIQVEDLAALFLARQAMGSVAGTKLAEVLRPAFEKLSRQLEGKVSMSWQSLDEAFAVKENGVVEADLTLFGKLAEAVLKQVEVTFRYRKGGVIESSERRIQPYHVGEISGGWYVIGHDLDRDGLRTFALQRIKGLQASGILFDRPVDFNIGRHLGGGVGVWAEQDGAEPVDVVLEVTGWVARMVQERLWHESQKTKLLDDYGQKVELSMRLSSLEEFSSIVLGWGRYAKVIEPPAMVEKIKEELAAMQALY